MQQAVLVTGGGGFIGTWVLRELLLRGLRPVVFDLQQNPERWERVLGSATKKITFVAGSMLDRELLRQTCRQQGVSHIIHLAALLTPACQQDPWVGCEVNVMGSMAIFEQIRASAGAINGLAYASSYAVYGPEADDAALGVTAGENRPPSFYGAFKLAVDNLAEQYWRHFGLASVGIRPHVAYGPERTQGLTAAPSQAIRSAASGQPFTINYTGSLGYDYVEDVALAFVEAALATPPGATVVDLPSQSATPQEFVQAIEQVLPGAAGLITVQGPAIPANIPPQPQYISQLFPQWRATELTAGIQKTIDFYRAKS